MSIQGSSINRYKNRSWQYKISQNCLKSRSKNRFKNSDESKFIVTHEFLTELAKKQNYKCYYTNIDIDFNTKSRSPFQPSLDRMDPSKPYSEDNCVLVTVATNYAKNDFSIEQFNNWINSIRSVNSK